MKSYTILFFFFGTCTLAVCRCGTDDQGDKITSVDDLNLDWCKAIKISDIVNNIGIDSAPDGAVYISGTFKDDVVFDIGELNETELNPVDESGYAFIAKYDPGGSLVWAKMAGGGNYSDAASDITTISDGSAIIVGEFRTSIIFNAGENDEIELICPQNDNSDYNDIFIARYNSDGSLAWAKQAGGHSHDIVKRIESFADDSVLILGTTPSEEIVFDEGSNTETRISCDASECVFLAKYDLNGILIWATSGAELQGVTMNDITTFPDGSFMAVGFESASDNSNILIKKFFADGTVDWTMSAEGDNRAMLTGVDNMPDGGFVITGHFGGTIIFDSGGPNETSFTEESGREGRNDIFVARYTSDKKLAWVNIGRGNGDSNAWRIDASDNGSVVTSGFYLNGIVFGQDESTSVKFTSNIHSDVGINVDFYIVEYDIDGTLLFAERSDYKENTDVSVEQSFDICFGVENSILTAGKYRQMPVLGASDPNETILPDTGKITNGFIAKYVH